MRVLGINGGPRRYGNTSLMLDSALQGAKSQGADVEKINLYDLDYTGCKSCFSCKLIDGKYHGKCALHDDLSPVLEKVLSSEVLILASPIYFGDVSGMTRCFLERLWFPSLLYRADGKVAYSKRTRVGLIFTMNAADPSVHNYDRLIMQYEEKFTKYIGEAESVFAADTYQFSNYSEYESGIFDEKHKSEVRKVQFPIDRRLAYELGVKFSRNR